MVKFNKKFFFSEETTKAPKEKPKKVKKEPKRSNRKTINFYGEKINYFIKKWLLVIILVIVLIILFLFIKGCSNNSNKPKKPSEINNGQPVIVDSISINLNQTVPTIQEFVKNYDKIKGENDFIKYDETNLVDNKYTSVGEYKVTLVIKGNEFTSRILVVDKEAPSFALKDVIITEGQGYALNDFVSSCTDNSGKDCILNYEKEEYGKYTVAGTFTVNIIASDLSGNKAKAQSAKLVINADASKKQPTPTGCTYGDATYTGGKVITYSIVKNNCAIDPSYAKTDTYITIPEKMAKDDLAKLKQEITNLNIEAKIQFDLSVEYVFNDAKTGIIGCTASIKATKIIDNETTEVLEDYSIRSNGTRAYTVNKLNLK